MLDISPNERDSNAPRFALNSEGFGLVEVMIAGAVMAVIMFTMASMSSNFNRSMLGVKTTASRTGIVAAIGSNAGSAKSILASLNYTGSAPGFPVTNGIQMLKNCALPGGPAGGCVAADGSGPIKYGFTLTDPMSNPVAGPGNSTPPNAAVYDTDGRLCGSQTTVTPDAKCPILASAHFVATCATGNSCDQAASIVIHYTVKQAPSVDLAGGSRMATISNSVELTTPLQGGPVAYGIVGQACGPEGVFRYDISLHAPIYCDDTLHWRCIKSSP
jgi:hypothetical protein